MGGKALSIVGLVGLLGIGSIGCVHLAAAPPKTPFGGRAVAIAVDPGGPSRMIVASETGGLFRSADSGATWSQVSGRSSFWFGDVKILPWNASVVIGAAASDTRTVTGGGIWRSADGGGTWSHVSVTPPDPSCTAAFGASALEVDPARNRIWAGTGCGLAHSDDSGVTWQFQPVVTGYSNDAVYAIAAPSAMRQVILTDSGVKVTSDGGASWTMSHTGLPFFGGGGVHNQIAVSPTNADHIYWAFNYWTWDSSGAQGHKALYASWNAGSNWTAVVDSPGINRPAIVRIGAGSGPGAAYTLYFADGGCLLQRTSVPGTGTPAITTWSSLSLDHCDPADVAFDPTHPSAPVLLATDGGLHRTADGGATWTTVGGGAVGYAALQITEVTGQLHSDRQSDDLYFGTQDNNLWASPDTGSTWTGSICCEGFFLNVLREPHPPADTKVNGVACSGCFNFISGPLFTGTTGFPNASGANGNPRLLRAGSYVEGTAVAGLTATVFDLTNDGGTNWSVRYGIPEAVADLPKIAGPESDPVIYTAIGLPGTTPAGNEPLSIKRVAGVLASGTPLVSNVSSFGSLGIFPTMFAWYKPFGVDPSDPNFLMVPDIVDHQVKVSTDAGATWTPDLALTSKVTQGGAFKFDWGPFGQVSSFGFDPDNHGHVLVGTVQAGVVETCDHGATWAAVENSDLIPAVSAFYFAGNNRVWISSYGRGLWTYLSTCPVVSVGPPRNVVAAEPTIYWKGARVPISQIHDPEVCPVCGYFLVTGGDIAEVTVDARTGEIAQATLKSGQMAGTTWDGKALQTPFPVVQGPTTEKRAEATGVISGDPKLAPLLAQGQHVMGLLVEGRQLKGLILSSGELRKDQLPRRVDLGPRIAVQVPEPDPAAPGRRGLITVMGTGFARKQAIRVTIDGRAVQVQEPTFDKDGVFTIRIPPTLPPGGHTLVVEQKTDGGSIRGVRSFLLPVEESTRR
jgi:hypothetical protein